MMHERVEELGGEACDVVRPGLNIASHCVYERGVHNNGIRDSGATRMQLPPKFLH